MVRIGNLGGVSSTNTHHIHCTYFYGLFQGLPEAFVSKILAMGKTSVFVGCRAFKVATPVATGRMVTISMGHDRLQTLSHTFFIIA